MKCNDALACCDTNKNDAPTLQRAGKAKSIGDFSLAYESRPCPAARKALSDTSVARNSRSSSGEENSAEKQADLIAESGISSEQVLIEKPARPKTNFSVAKLCKSKVRQRPMTWAASRSSVRLAALPKRTFTIMPEAGASGIFVRKAFKRRGWTEIPMKRSISPVRKRSSRISAHSSRSQSSTTSCNSVGSGKIDTKFRTSMNFLWTVEAIRWETVQSPDTIVNQIPTPIFSFASKVGLLACAQRSHWFHERNYTQVCIPRCYRLFIDEELASFVGDFCLTACIGLIQHVTQAKEASAIGSVFNNETGRVEGAWLKYAIDCVRQYVRCRDHEDIDDKVSTNFCDTKWSNFFKAHHKIVYRKAKFKCESAQEAKSLAEDAVAALKSITPYWPQLGIDGIHNLWICKPGEASQGMGILVMNNLSKILKTFCKHRRNWDNSVVQKYIERPLLIYNTKFDIRQWFLVTSWYPLIVWFYKDCYLRFCSKPFDMLDFHERVHLCNYSVQSRYKIDQARDSKLPPDNMWSCASFQQYLKEQGKEGHWLKIYGAMRKEILGLLLPSQEYFSDRNTPNRKNSFQLYGADFMLTDDLKPWLIEINRFPLLASYPRLMRQMCEKCVEDCVKVVIDRQDDQKADTGQYELIYHQRTPPSGLFSLRYDIMVQGVSVFSRSSTKNKPQSTQSLKNPAHASSSRKIRVTRTAVSLSLPKSSLEIPKEKPPVATESKQLANRRGVKLRSAHSANPVLLSQRSRQLVNNGNDSESGSSITLSILSELIATIFSEKESKVRHTKRLSDVSSICVKIIDDILQSLVDSKAQ